MVFLGMENILNNRLTLLPCVLRWRRAMVTRITACQYTLRPRKRQEGGNTRRLHSSLPQHRLNRF